MVFLFCLLILAFGILVILKLGVYRQLLIYLALMQIFTFAIKVGYGTVNTTVLALFPVMFVGVMLFSLLLLQIQGNIQFRFSLLDFFVMSFFVLDFIQIFNPYLGALNDLRFLNIGIRGFQQRTIFGLVYFVVRWMQVPNNRFVGIVRTLTYSISLGSVYAVLQQFFSFTFLESTYRLNQIAIDPLLQAQYLSRAVGFLGSPYTFGLMSATGFLCSVYLFSSVHLSKNERFLVFICILLNAIAIILSGSRSTYFTLLLIGFISIIAMRLSLLSITRYVIYFSVSMAGIFIFLILFFPSSVPVKYSLKRIESVKQIFASSDSIKDNNFIVRRNNIIASGPMILAGPLGYGTGIFNGGSNPDGLVNVNGYATFMDNEFVALTLELGIIGTFIFCSIVTLSIYRCRFALRSPCLRSRARILAALVLICPIASVGGQWLAAYPVNIVFWTSLGLIAGLPISGNSNLSIMTIGSETYLSNPN